MALLPILAFPNPTLAQRADPVSDDALSGLRPFIDNLTETMYAAQGVGLAAPQVGRLIRVFVVDCDGSGPFVIINPEIVPIGTTQSCTEEGCLSLPGVQERIPRADRVLVTHTDLATGVRLSFTATGLFAIAIQHEFDHLDGVLMRDRVSPLKRRMMDKVLAKQRSGAEGGRTLNLSGANRALSH